MAKRFREAFAEGGIIGPVFERRHARLMAEQADADRNELVNGMDIGVDELVRGSGDPEIAAAFQDQFKTYQGMARARDGETQRAGLAGLAQLSSAVREAMQHQRDQQSARVMDTAKDMRGKAQAALAPMREMQANTEQIYKLLGDPEFDQNLALNRGELIGLLQSNARQMLTDPDDMGDALRAVNGGGLLGSIVQLAAGKMSADDFNFLKEDYRRLADANYLFQKQKYLKTLAPIEAEAAQLEKASATLDLFPPGYSLSTYIVSDPEQFNKPASISFPEPAPKVPTLGTVASGTEKITTLLDAVTGNNAAATRADTGEAIPSSGIPGRPAGGGFFAPFRAGGAGDGPTEFAELERRMGAFPDGTGFKVDPKTGRVFAYPPGGERTEVDTSGGVFGAGGDRGSVLRYLKRRSQIPSGIIDRSRQQ